MKKVIGKNWQKRMAFVCFLLLGVLAEQAGAEQGKGFPGKAVLAKMQGQWTSEGELTSVTGDVIKVSETWEGKFIDEGKGFEIKGDRLWNGESQTFAWLYSYNSSTELLDVIYTASDQDKEIPMEVSVNEAEGSITRRAMMGTEGAEIMIETKFVKGELITEVVITGSDGQVALQGSFKHIRKKA